MKQLNLYVDPNGHVRSGGNGGVMGEHNAMALQITLEEPMENIQYYRLFFAGENRSVATEELTLENDAVTYVLPADITSLGHAVMVQLCGYQMQGDTVNVLFKSDAVPVTFSSGLPDTAALADTELSDRLNAMLDEVEAFYRDFSLQMGTVTTLAPGASATASLARSDMAFTLNLGIPRGQAGTVLTAGNGIAINNNIVSVDSGVLASLAKVGRNTVYAGSYNQYGALGIIEQKNMADFAGSVVLVMPPSGNTQTGLSFFTSGEGAYYPIKRRQADGQLTANLPVGCVQANRIMMLYVSEIDAGNNTFDVIYLNPCENPMPLYTLTVHNDPSFPTLGISGAANQEFIGGKTILALAPQDIVFGSARWYGPMMSQVSVFNGSSWTDTTALAGKTMKAGSPVVLYLEYDEAQLRYNAVRLLNPPADAPAAQEDTWHEVNTSVENLKAYYKKSGSIVCVRFRSVGYASITGFKILFDLPASYVSTAITSLPDALNLPCGSTYGHNYGFSLVGTTVCFDAAGNHTTSIDTDLDGIQLLFMI